MPKITCTYEDCANGTIYHENGMLARCDRCRGTGAIEVAVHPLQAENAELKAKIAALEAQIAQFESEKS